MTDPIRRLLTIAAEQIQQNPDADSDRLVEQVEGELETDPELRDAVAAEAFTQTSEQAPAMTQANSDEVRAFQTAVSGGTVQIGGQYGVNAAQLSDILEKLMPKLSGPSLTGIPNNLPRSGAVKFVGREQRLKDLHAQLQDETRLVPTSIVGMGGIGKTELALQYAIGQYGAGQYAGGVCWLGVRDQEMTTLLLRFAQLNLAMDLPELETVDQVRYCWQHWPAGEVLIVLDDVTDYSEILPYLPPSDPRFKLLLTTRLELGRRVKRFGIQELDEENALALLASLAGEARVRAEVSEAALLCKWVGYLPLGLRLVGQYLADNVEVSLWDLAAELEDVGLDAEALQAVQVGEITEALGVVQALELSWGELNAAAQDLACLLGMFALAPIPWGLVQQCWPDVEDRTLKQSRKALIDCSLLKRVGNGTFQLHQIVQEFFRVKLKQKPEQGSEIRAAFCGALVRVARGIEYGLTLAKVNEVSDSIVHLEELATRWTDSLSDEDLTWPFTGISSFYQGQGSYSLSLPWDLACLEQAKNRFGEAHPDVATSLNDLANLYRDQGKYEQAEPLYVDALAMYKQLLGEAHPDVATS
ncbi:MAG: tetratricopeptide repeat protein, partial [Phormidesmis sp.]